MLGQSISSKIEGADEAFLEREGRAAYAALNGKNFVD